MTPPIPLVHHGLILLTVPGLVSVLLLAAWCVLAGVLIWGDRP